MMIYIFLISLLPWIYAQVKFSLLVRLLSSVLVVALFVVFAIERLHHVVEREELLLEFTELVIDEKLDQKKFQYSTMLNRFKDGEISVKELIEQAELLKNFQK